MIFSITAAGISLFQDRKKGNKKETYPLAKSIKILNQNGELLLEYKDCYISYLDKTTYLLSHEYKGEAFLKIDKGNNMLLVVEFLNNTIESKKGE